MPLCELARCRLAPAGPLVGDVVELEPSDAIVRALATHTPLGIFVSDADGSCVYVNERWCELSGLTPEQALGNGWVAALHPDDKKRVLGEWTKASWTDSDSIVEYRILRPDGGVSWIEGFASALRDDGGLVTGWVGSCLDVTTRKRAEDAAAASQRTLPGCVRQRPDRGCADHAGRPLARCQRRALRADRLRQS